MSTITNIDVLTDEWVKKLHFENRVDLNLQIPTSGESIKVEIGDIPSDRIPQLDIPSFDNTKQKNQHKSRSDTQPVSIPTSDSYLSSIVSSAKSNSSINNDPSPMTTTSAPGSCLGTLDCSCYKCQRQRRRAGTRNRTIPIEPPLAAMNDTTTAIYTPPPITTQQKQERASPKGSLAPSPTTPSPSSYASNKTPTSVKRNGSYIQRKNPSMVSYEKHLPRPTYSELDSIYRSKRLENKVSSSSNSTQQQQQQQQQGNDNINQDSYEISWQDESGDDILTSLRTFQTIFEEKPVGSEGLSDLLETRAQELKRQKLQEQEELANLQRMEPNRPPRRSDCLTLSYRDGALHKHLTLYHTMKMNGPTERMAAYGKTMTLLMQTDRLFIIGRALQHCVRADSGLTLWLEKQSDRPPPSAMTNSHRPKFTLKKSTKRSILHLPGRKQKNTAEDLWLRTNKLTDSPTPLQTTSNDNVPIDVLSTANALMPSPPSNQSTTVKTPSNSKPYDYIDTPSRPVNRNRNSVDKDSLTSLDMERSTKSGKFWSSLGRKASRSRSNSPSIHSVEKTYQPPSSISETPESFDKALDDLCQIMTHVDRSVLQSYLEQANGDYMKTLSIIRAEVTAGKL
ncbi:hypothetical protein BC941DRAFT_158280 [Chlamydoabsidia padenii]|nr:hypothetical protein BC941DRAFT_158280 [Chlamydoabsidia padenii]